MSGFLPFLLSGFEHVIPLGYDHILFIVSLFFIDSRLKTALFQCTLFTIAHSLTLAMVALKHISVNAFYVEIIIALSIFFVAIENLFLRNVRPWRLILVFVFGLIHGAGFAAALLSAGLPERNRISALLGFNIGVELAQVLLILCCYWLVARPLSQKQWYRQKLTNPLSLAIASLALFWAVQRFLQ